jgi:hypothetical protein
MMLRKCVAPVLSAAANIDVETLAAALIAARVGGEPTYQLCAIRTRKAELLESLGRHREAAGLYRENIACSAKYPAAFLVLEPSDEWANLGLALYEAGDFDAAAEAYEAGLTANEGDVAPTVKDGNPAWRETARLRLLELLLSARRKQKADQEAVCDVVMRIFEPYVARSHDAAADDGGQVAVHVDEDGRVWVEMVSSGKRFVLRKSCSARTGTDEGWGVEEVAKGAPVPPAHVTGAAGEATTRRARSQAVGSARTIVDLRHEESKLPDLPPPQCAQCGALTAIKRCSGCRQVGFCSVSCQAQHWGAGHKNECRRMAAAASSAAAAAAKGKAKA